MKKLQPNQFCLLAVFLFAITVTSNAQKKDTLHFRNLKSSPLPVIIEQEGQKEIHYYLEENGPLRSAKRKNIDYISYSDGFQRQIGPGQLLLNKPFGVSFSADVSTGESGFHGNLTVDYMFKSGLDAVVKIGTDKYLGGMRFFFNHKTHSRTKAAFGLLLGTQRYDYSYEYSLTRMEPITKGSENEIPRTYNGSGSDTAYSFATSVPLEVSYINRYGLFLRAELAYNLNFYDTTIDDVFEFSLRDQFASFEIGLGYRF